MTTHSTSDTRTGRERSRGIGVERGLDILEIYVPIYAIWYLHTCMENLQPHNIYICLCNFEYVPVACIIATLTND